MLHFLRGICISHADQQTRWFLGPFMKMKFQLFQLPLCVWEMIQCRHVAPNVPRVLRAVGFSRTLRMLSVHMYVLQKLPLFCEFLFLPNKLGVLLVCLFLPIEKLSWSHFLYFGKPRVHERQKQRLELHSHSEIRKSLFLAGALSIFC